MIEEELENPASWDYERAERHPGSKQARAVVSVAFRREDFETVATAAEGASMRLSEFIRSAALEKATSQRDVMRAVLWTFSMGAVLFARPSPRTAVVTKIRNFSPLVSPPAVTTAAS